MGAERCRFVEDGHSHGLGGLQEAGAEGEGEEGGLEDGSPLDQVLAGVGDGHLTAAALAQSGGAHGQLLRTQYEAGRPHNLRLFSWEIENITDYRSLHCTARLDSEK